MEPTQKKGFGRWIAGGIVLGVLIYAAYVLLIKVPAANGDTGVLTGQVTVEGICGGPDTASGTPCVTSPDDVRSRIVIVYAATVLKREVARANLTPFGEYRFELPPGQYTVDIAKNGADSSKALPATVSVDSKKTTTLNFTIDTGAR